MTATILIVGTQASTRSLCEGLGTTDLAHRAATTTTAARRAIQDADLACVVLDMAAGGLNPLTLCEQAVRQSIPVAAFNVSDTHSQQKLHALGIEYYLDQPPDWPAFQGWLHGGQSNHTTPSGLATLLGSTTTEIEGAATLLIHDLKSPVSVIISSLEVLLTMHEADDNEDDTNARLLRGALQAAYRQMHLVTDLVDLARLELDIYELETGPCDVVRVMQECLNSEQYALDMKGLTLERSLPDSPLYALADRELLMRVIYVMLDNTLKFTVRSDTLRIEAYSEPDAVVLRFIDTGRPVMASYRDTILRQAPQWQQRQDGTRTSVGMGLPFVNAVARRLNGRFEVHSDLASGQTTFTLKFPHAP